MGRIGVIADAHGNLPATVASLDALVHRGCETVVHVGDAVGIGPHPSEVVSLLLERRTVCLMGNHDEWLAFGVPEPRPPWMSEGEAEHHRWVRAQLSAAQRSAVRGWPYEVAIRLGERTVVFVHYARRHGQFSYLAHPTGAELGKIYERLRGDVVVFGHDHRPHDLTWNRRRFLSPGSLGCHDRPEARALVLDLDRDGCVAAEWLAVAYDDAELLADLDRRHVPERDFIRRAFFARPPSVAGGAKGAAEAGR